MTCTNTNQMEKYALLVMSAQLSFLFTFGRESVCLANWPLTVLAEFYKDLLVKWGNDYCPSYSRESVFAVCQSVRGFSCLSCGQLCGQFNACKTRNLQRECFQTFYKFKETKTITRLNNFPAANKSISLYCRIFTTVPYPYILTIAKLKWIMMMIMFQMRVFFVNKQLIVKTTLTSGRDHSIWFLVTESS